MAGHSKWANIQHRKGAQDAKRGKLFTKFIREITVAAKEGGSDIANNPRLRAAIDKALSGNMTRDVIERATKRGAGELEGVTYEEIRYEGYAPGGVAVLVDCMTDNRNRTVSEVRHIFSKHGGNLGTDGSVAYLFNKVGLFVFDSAVNEESVMEAAVGAGADDVETADDGTIEVLTAPEAFAAVSAALNDAGLQAEVAELVQRPSNEAPVSEADAEKVMNLIDALEELDDVQEVATNASFQEGSAVAG